MSTPIPPPSADEQAGDPLTLRRSRVVARILQSHIREDRLVHTLGLWRREYEHQSEPAIFEFMGRVKHRLLDQRAEKQVIQAIWNGFHQLDGLSPAPSGAPEPGPESTPSGDRCQLPDELLHELARVIHTQT